MKVIPYILVVIALVLGGGIYFYHNKSDKPVLNGALRNADYEVAAEPPARDTVQFSNLGSAPEFAATKDWMNSPPLTVAQLRGKVVLVNFWSYSSITSIRSLPYLNKWYSQYKDKGLEIIGVHTPEFAFGKIKPNVATAVQRYKITYPVVQDNNYKIWKAYKNQFWPAQYLIDKDGNIVYLQLGEGNYEATEKALRTLLGMEGEFKIPTQPEVNKLQTPEIYFGLTKLSAFGGAEKPSTENQIFVYPEKLAKNKFALEGNWQFDQEGATHTKGFGRIKLNFNAAKVYLVAQSNKPTTIKIYVDGTLIKGVVVRDSQLYELFNSLQGKAHTMEIEVPEGGFEAFTFTFG